MSFMDYGATGHRHNDSKQQGAEDVRILTVSPSAGSSSSSNAAHGRNDYRHGSQDATISADELAPSVDGIRYRTNTSSGIDEKMALMNHQQPDQSDIDGTQQQAGKGEHHHHLECFHAPGEHCSLPDMMQPLVSPLHHAAVENVVIKVLDSADVTQKTIFYFWDEWKLFVNRGNVIDLGIGVVIGGAFSDIIDSFVADILTPPLSLWAAGANLENSFFVLRQGRTPGKVYATYQEAQADGAV
ncbi:hypothetical protein BGZ79_003373 [Entomortierella chlamydospora]|nr:hypothetical protein BGZ79_003373 [Entomortierella chlamydospora]